MLLISVHLLLCLFLVVVILLQPGKSDGGIGFGSSSQTIFGSKGAGNFLTKTTSAFAFAFLLTSLMVTRCEIDRHKPIDIEKAGGDVPVGSAQTTPAPTPTATPETKSSDAPVDSKTPAAKSGEGSKGKK